MKIFLFTTLLFFICATPAQAQVILSEVYPAPTSEEKEWVELYNSGEESVDITGWSLFEHFANKNELTTFFEVVIEPKGFFVFELASNKLNNSEEKITLEDAMGSEVSALHYTNSQSQKSFSFLFLDENTVSETLEVTLPTRGATNPLQLIPTPTPTTIPTPILVINPTNPTTPPEINIEQIPVTIDQNEQITAPLPNYQLELHKKINEILKMPKLERIEKVGLEKYTPKLSYLIQTKASDKGIISAIIGGTLLLFTGILL